MVAARHVNAKALRGRCAARVDGAQHHGGQRGCAGGWRPGQHTVAAQCHARRPVDQQVAQRDAVGIDPLHGIAVGLADGGLGDRRAEQQRGRVGIRQRVDAGAQISPQALVAGQRDGLQHRRFTRRQPRPGASQVNQPQVALGRAAHRRHTKVAARVEHQLQRRAQCKVSDIGDAQVVRHRARGAVGAGRLKSDLHVG